MCRAEAASCRQRLARAGPPPPFDFTSASRSRADMLGGDSMPSGPRTTRCVVASSTTSVTSPHLRRTCSDNSCKSKVMSSAWLCSMSANLYQSCPVFFSRETRNLHAPLLHCKSLHTLKEMCRNSLAATATRAAASSGGTGIPTRNRHTRQPLSGASLLLARPAS